MKAKFRLSSLIILLAALGFGGYQAYRFHQAAARPPVIERKIERNSPRGLAPVPEYLLRQAPALALTPAQVAQVTRIAAAYRHDVAPALKQLDAASKNYADYVDRHGQGTRLSLQEVEKHAADVRGLSSVVVTTRHAYWQQARAVLTAPQRRQAEELLKHSTLNDLR